MAIISTIFFGGLSLLFFCWWRDEVEARQVVQKAAEEALNKCPNPHTQWWDDVKDYYEKDSA